MATNNSPQLRERTKVFALRIIKLVEALPNSKTANHIGGQLLRCGTSVAANYRAACRGRSPAEFASKLGIVEEEADESLFWLEMLIDARIMAQKQLAPLMEGAHEILSMVVASIRTTRSHGSTSPRKVSRSSYSSLRTPNSALT